tara:strand:+ start:4147 stop:5415 length:1269 start_codon:yes stop_codon:yes gene_type:complete
MPQLSSSTDFTDLLDYLYNLQRFGIKVGLSHTIKLLKRCGNPQNNFQSIHVAGTNGKGSTCAMTAAILMAAGYKVGMYSSPHLICFNERIQINNNLITDDQIISFVKDYKQDIEEIESTFFETTTAMAFHHFSNHKVDVAVIETGLGGRLDSTNVLRPIVTAITPISMDHREILGNNIQKIAKEKGGIIKPRVPLVLGSQEDSVKSILFDIAIRNGSKKIKQVIPNEIKFDASGTVFNYDNIRFQTKLIGEHQAFNAALSISIVSEFNSNINPETIQKGLDNTHWPGRLQKLSESPSLFYDVAHNPEGINAILSTIQTIYKCNPVGLFVMKEDKETEIIASAIKGRFESLIISGGENYGLMTASQLAKALKENGIDDFTVENSIINAMVQFSNNSKKLNMPGVIFGSHYIAKEVFDKFGFLV